MGMRIILLSLLVFLIATPVWAATPAAKSETAPSVTINPDNLKSLIQTLESETARTEFINNLKTLEQSQKTESAADEVESNPAIVLSEQIGLETQTQGFFTEYHKFLADNNLNATTVGKWAMTAGATIIGFLLIFGVGKASNWARRGMTRFAGKFSVNHTTRFRLYARILKFYGYYLLFSLYLYAIAVIWDFSDAPFFKSETSGVIFFGIMNIVVVIMIAALIGETINGSIEYCIRRASNSNAQRIRTLLPIVRNIVFMIFFILFGLVLLSAFGIDVVPLLAGAGVVGVAIGIGAQKFLQDFFTGFAIILEDLFHVGDVVNVGGISGAVETISLRKVQLRGYDGTVYTVPFSEIKIVQNMTKDFSFFSTDLAVSYREDTDRVIATMQEVAKELRGNEFKDVILDDMEIAGVDRFSETGVIIKARIKTRPGQQWNVGREFNRRIKILFDKRGIQTPLPYQTVVFNSDQDVRKSTAVAQVEPEKDHKQDQE